MFTSSFHYAIYCGDEQQRLYLPLLNPLLGSVPHMPL